MLSEKGNDPQPNRRLPDKIKKTKVMKTLLENVSYNETSAYVNRNAVEEYAERTEQDFDSALNDLESYLCEYSFVEEEKDGSIIFHKDEENANLVINSIEMCRARGYGQYSIVVEFNAYGENGKMGFHTTDSELWDNLSDYSEEEQREMLLNKIGGEQAILDRL